MAAVPILVAACFLAKLAVEAQLGQTLCLDGIGNRLERSRLGFSHLGRALTLAAFSWSCTKRCRRNGPDIGCVREDGEPLVRLSKLDSDCVGDRVPIICYIT